MQNAEVPSASNSHCSNLLSSNLKPQHNWFTDSTTNNFAHRANENNVVYTAPISVRPKTREPQTFTDNRIYVSNIPFSFREQDLASMFYVYGKVLSVEIVTNDRGSKGFGFVTLDSIEACEKARADLHESHVQGRIIEVRRATPTRRKITNTTQMEVMPPPKLCVDLRAPHSSWRTEPFDANAPTYHQAFVTTSQPFQARRPFGLLNESRKCMRHADLKLSLNGDYYMKNGEPTTDNSLLMCIGGGDCKGNHQNEAVNVSASEVEFPEMFQNHIHDQINSLLDTSNNQPRRADSVGSTGVRTSESETASDDEHNSWTPNRSPDLLASLYEGSTSFH
ncbi:unnamed protein product [Caenorhabditis angaria]|uniref:RRM domain-containing protein n=1 Tax=Caenorhabditis angaria TaxID=860376 RepID=A0A9P1IXI3_9PELO|nr:unnamed protein product [Caenorhabditis angaria]